MVEASHASTIRSNPGSFTCCLPAFNCDANTTSILSNLHHWPADLYGHFQPCHSHHRHNYATAVLVLSNIISIAQYAAMGKLNWRNLLPKKVLPVRTK